MTVAVIFTKIGNFVEKVLIFMPLNCNCTKLAIFWRFSDMLRGVFPWTRCIYTRSQKYIKYICRHHRQVTASFVVNCNYFARLKIRYCNVCRPGWMCFCYHVNAVLLFPKIIFKWLCLYRFIRDILIIIIGLFNIMFRNTALQYTDIVSIPQSKFCNFKWTKWNFHVQTQLIAVNNMFRIIVKLS